MRHHYLNNFNLDPSHYAVGKSRRSVLVQLGDESEQVRLSLTKEQAIHFSNLLIVAIGELETEDLAASKTLNTLEESSND